MSFLDKNHKGGPLCFFREGKGACVMRYDFQKFVRYPPGSSGGCKCMFSISKITKEFAPEKFDDPTAQLPIANALNNEKSESE